MDRQSFLGTGWRFEMDPDEDLGLRLEGGLVAEASEEAAVRQSVWLILSTAPGERVARPDFGCAIHDLVFGLTGAKLTGDVINAVESALGRWEPRVDVLRVDARPAQGDEALLLIDLHYAIRATNSRFNLVYPFYLS